MSSSLSLLGLALRGGNAVLGEEQVSAAASLHRARLLLLAVDAGESAARQTRHLAGEKLPLAELAYTKAELGQAVGRKFCTLAAVTDIGLAAAIADRLAKEFPGRYDALAKELTARAKKRCRRQKETRTLGPKKNRGRFT